MNFGFQGIIPEKGTIGELAVQMVENRIDLNFGQSSNMFEQNSDDIYNNNNITNHNDDYNNNDIKKEKRKYKKKKESFVFDQKKFDRFWSSYGRIDKILLTVDAYVRWKHEIKYRKMPATYLRQRAWEDSIPSEFLSAQNNQETSKYQLPHGAVY
jgi:hypothetical protein